MKKEHKFATNSDSEIIVHLFEEYGNKCVEMLDGMFAFVLATDDGYVLAARDHVGIKYVLDYLVAFAWC